MEVIEKINEPTDWVNSLVTVVKANNTLRICLDPKDLNKAIKRHHHPMTTVEEVVSRMPEAKIFTVLDAASGFWQIKLDRESSKLCTFNTPFGRYMFKRMPFGISSASEIFQRYISQTFEGLPGVECIMDDILVWGSNEEEHYQRLKSVLDKAKQMNLKLNKDKCQIEKTEIKYIGHILSKDGLKADPDKIKAVLDMPAPTDKKGLERFNGMIQYLAKFIPNLSEISAPIRKLCEGNVAWHWDSEQEDSFNKLKKLVTNTPVLQYYDVNKDVTLSVDSSMLGLGAVLFQENKPIAYASKALTKSQQNYAQIEKEMLAIVFGCEKFHDYLSGKKQITVESDHKPLESIFKKPLYRAPIRLQRMLLTLQKYPLNVHFKPGKEMYVADTLSRAYLTDGNCVTSEDRFHVNMIEVSMSENKLSEIRSKTESDSELCKLKQTVLEGWPDTRNEVPEEIQKYWNIRDEITIAEDILFKAAKVIIPAEMRQEMLRQIHSAHFGI